MSKRSVFKFKRMRLMASLFSLVERRARRVLGLVFGFAVLSVAGPAIAMTDCSVVLQNGYIGDIYGNGTYALFLTYSYTASGGSAYTGQGYLLLSSPQAAAMTAAVLEAKATQQMNLTIRYENTSGASQDQVCEAASPRSDLIGMWLP